MIQELKDLIYWLGFGPQREPEDDDDDDLVYVPYDQIVIIKKPGTTEAYGLIPIARTIREVRQAMFIPPGWTDGSRIYMKRPYPYDLYESGKYDDLEEDFPEVYKLIDAIPEVVEYYAYRGFVHCPNFVERGPL